MRPVKVFIVSLVRCDEIFDGLLAKHCPRLLGITSFYDYYSDLMRSIMGHELRRDLADADLGYFFREAGMPPEKATEFLCELCRKLEEYMSFHLPEKIHHENYEVIRNGYETLYFREKC